MNKELKPALVGLKNTPNLENAQVLSRERVILRVFPYIWRLGSRRMSGFRTRQSGGVSWMVTGRALSHLSFSALPPGPTTGMHAPASQAGSRVCESGCSSLWQANANAFFSLFVFNLHAVPVSHPFSFFRLSPWVLDWRQAMLRRQRGVLFKANAPTSGFHSCVSLDKTLSHSLHWASPSVKWGSIQKIPMKHLLCAKTCSTLWWGGG